MARRRAGSGDTTTWGELTEQHTGRVVTWRWPWDEDATGTLVAAAVRWTNGGEGQRRTVHVIDYGGDVGEQDTMRDDAAEVALP